MNYLAFFVFIDSVVDMRYQLAIRFIVSKFKFCPLEVCTSRIDKRLHTRLNWIRYLTQKISQPNKQTKNSEIFVLSCLFLDLN